MAAVAGSRYVVIMLALVCRHDSSQVAWSPFNVFAHIAAGAGALVVASANRIKIIQERFRRNYRDSLQAPNPSPTLGTGFL